MSFYLRDVTFWNRSEARLQGGNLVVEAGPQDDRIVEPGRLASPDAGGGGLRMTSAPPQPQDEVIDCSGQLAMEGLTCGHHHIYSALARGMPAPPRAPRDFAEILELVWWRLDKRLDLEMVRACALSAAIDALRCGVTRIVDHHASPNAVVGSLETIAETLDGLGVSHLLCYEISGRDGSECAKEGLRETQRHLASGRPGMVGLHASFTVDDDLLAAAVALARKHAVGIHLHVAEGAVDQERCLAEHGKRVVARLHEAGLLDLPGSLLVHALHLDPAERALVRASSAWIAHNPESNQNNGVGSFSLEGLDPGRVLLGTDGLHGDMLRSLRAAFLSGSARPAAPAGKGTASLAAPAGGLDLAQAWNALWNSQAYLERHHPAATRGNDVVVFDYDPPTPLTDENLLGHIGYGLDARHVSTVIAGGRLVLRNGRFVDFDEAAALKHCREQARRLWAALERPWTRR